jgi:glutaredoxin 3
MAKVTLYSTQSCPYCVRAKMLLSQKGAEYDEVDVSEDSAREAMIKKANGKRSVPQIFIGDAHVGGFDDLAALELEGKLDSLLNA